MDSASALPLVLMTLGAIAMPAFARKVAIPVAVAEIVYGMVLGGTGLGLVKSTEFIRFLADVGFAFFMFLAGLEIDFRGIEKRGIRTGSGRLIMSVLAFVLAIGLGQKMGWSVWVCLAIGATSIGLLVAVMRETGIGGTTLGNTMMGQGAVGEAVTILALSIAHLHHEVHGGWPLVMGLLRMLILAGAAVLVVVTLRALLWWFPRPFTRMVAADDPAEFGVRVGFGLMFAFVGLSLLSGVEPFLGAFIAGAMLTFVIRDKGALEHKLASMAYGFFVPVFFIHVGINLNLKASVLIDNFFQVVAIILAMFLVKFIPSLGMLSSGFNIRQVTIVSLLLAAPLTLVIAIVDIGVRAHAIDPTSAAVMVFSGIVASLLYPTLAKQLLRRRDEATLPEPITHT